jgi:hypothetical protein
MLNREYLIKLWIDVLLAHKYKDHCDGSYYEKKYTKYDLCITPTINGVVVGIYAKDLSYSECITYDQCPTIQSVQKFAKEKFIALSI